MEGSEPQSFIIKIWLEDTLDEADEATWRGHITHVPSGERRYLKSLADIGYFVARYLAAMGVKVDPPRSRSIRSRLW